MDDEKDIEEEKSVQPQNTDFSQLIASYCEKRNFKGARELCLESLKENCSNNLARLSLAKVFFLDEMPEFCIRELKEIYRNFPSESLSKIIELLGADLKEEEQSEEKVVSEIEVEFDE